MQDAHDDEEQQGHVQLGDGSECTVVLGDRWARRHGATCKVSESAVIERCVL